MNLFVQKNVLMAGRQRPKGSAKPKAAPGSKGPVGMQLAGKTLPQKTSHAFIVAFVTCCYECVFPIVDPMVFLCAQGNEVKKEIQALNSLQIDVGDLDMFKGRVEQLKQFPNSMKLHFHRCATRMSNVDSCVFGSAGQFDRRLHQELGPKVFVSKFAL